MNRKGILIGVLAALMLFAFTACEPSASILTSITGAVVNGGGEKVYLPGETVDLSDYTFYVIKTDGTKEIANASDFDFGEDGPVVPVSGDVKGNYRGMSDSNFEVTLDVNRATVSSITVDATADDVLKTYYATVSSDEKYTTDLIDLTGVVITAKYTDENGVAGEKVIDPENPEVKATMSSWTANNSNTITVSYAGQSGTAYSVSVVANRITALELKASENYKLYRNAIDTAKSTLQYSADGSNGIYLEATYLNGEVKKLAEASNVSYLQANGTYGATKPVISTASTLSVTVQYTGAEGVAGLNNVCTLANPIPVEDEKLVGIKISGLDETTTLTMKDYSNATAESEFEFKKGGTTDTELVVTPVYASGSTTGVTALSYKAADKTWSFTEPASLDLEDAYENNTRVTMTVTGTVNGVSASASFSVVMVDPQA